MHHTKPCERCASIPSYYYSFWSMVTRSGKAPDLKGYLCERCSMTMTKLLMRFLADKPAAKPAETEYKGEPV